MRSAEIADWLIWTRIGASRAAVKRYARTAAAWENLRLRIDTSTASPADAADFKQLTIRMREMVKQFGLTEKRWHLVPVAASEDGENAVRGVTDPNGFLLGDPARLLSGTWQESAVINDESNWKEI
jgi:hypothetical protein